MTASEQHAEYADAHTPTIGAKIRAAIEADREQALREEIAGEIEAEAELRDSCADWRDGMDDAARIARGGAR